MSRESSFQELMRLKVYIEKSLHVVKLLGPTLTNHLQTGNWSAISIIQKKVMLKLLNLLMAPAGVLFVLVMRMIRPWLLIRINILISGRIGHFAINTELYLCERDAGINRPEGRYVDVWFYNWPICNRQLALMWNRVLHVGPGWLLAPAKLFNSLIPGGEVHNIGNNTQGDVDVHNLLDRLPPHLSFLSEEEKRGEECLCDLGIPEGAPFVCLFVRDSSYLKKTIPWKSFDYHNYRDCNIQNYVLAALELADRGYYVIRMGASVKEAMDVDHPKIIDYASNGMRSDFMDIYLSAKCTFFISNGFGLDTVPIIFRRPVVYVDNLPMEYLCTYTSNLITTTKKHWLRDEGRFMSFREIYESGAGRFLYSRQYKDMGIDLIESDPEEIAAVVLEMEERLKGSWHTTEEDEELQHRFWKMFPRSELHGEIRSRIGADFLRRHKDWLK